MNNGNSQNTEPDYSALRYRFRHAVNAAAFAQAVEQRSLNRSPINIAFQRYVAFRTKSGLVPEIDTLAAEMGGRPAPLLRPRPLWPPSR